MIAPVLLWSTVEEAVATIVANAPILRVLVFHGRNFASGQTSGHGYTRDDSGNETYEMVSNRKGVIARVSGPQKQDGNGVTDDNSMVVLRTVEVTVENRSASGKDGDVSSCDSSTWT